MVPFVYEYARSVSAGDQLVDIYGPFVGLRSSEACVVLGVVSALLLMRAAARDRRRQPPDLLARASLAAPALMLVTMYCLTWGSVDEVAIGLEHSYNLNHFGRFSFSPTRMVDGTVEGLYFLLLAPFAWSPLSAVGANFGFGLLIALAHLWVLSQILKDATVSARLGLLLLFSVNYPLMALLSSGFGNGLVSLVFLRAVQLLMDGRTHSALLVGSGLPLLRPDAILYSYALVMAVSFRVRRPTDPRPWLAWLLPLGALGLYFAAFRMLYGHWIPTPALFKSVYPSMVTLESLKSFAVYAMAGLTQPTHLLGLLAAMASAAFTADGRHTEVRRLLLPLAAIYLFYSFSRGVYGDLAGDSYARYWIGFEMVLFLCLVLVVSSCVRLLASLGRGHDHVVVGSLLPVAVVALVFGAIAWDGQRDYRPSRSTLGHAGQIVAEVLPADFSVATSELNAFGLNIPTHEVIDLWGYTNRVIARSRVLNGFRVRSSPEFFATVRPDVYFAFEELADGRDAEDYLATFDPFVKSVNLLGDMVRVLDEYDIVVVRHPLRSIVLLVRRVRVEEFLGALERHQYAASAKRPFDRERFGAAYDAQELVQYPF